MGGSREALRVVRAVGRNHALRRELLAYLLFDSAELATWIAMLVFAFDRGGASAAGFVAVVQLVPAIFVAPIGSILGDRLRRDHALQIGYAAQVVTLAVTAVALNAEAPIWLIYGCAAVSASAMTLTRPVHNALLPELAETPKELTASNSVSGMLSGVSVLTGPIAAGVMLQLGSPALVYAVMAIAQVGAFLLALGLRVHVLGRGEAGPPEPLLSGALGGFRAMRDEPGAAVLAGLTAAQSIVGGLFDVLVIGFAIDALHLGQGGPGILTAGDGVGGLIGAAATIVLIGRRRLAPAIGLGILVCGVFLALVAIAPSTGLTILLFAGSAIGLTFYEVAARTLLQRTVDDEALARFFGVEEGLSMVGLAIGAAIAPFLVAAFGIRGSFVAAGAFLPLLALITWGRVRALDARAHVPQPELGLLQAVDLFEPLPPPILERLAWNLLPRQAKAGEAIIVEGDEGDLFFLIVEGHAAVTVGGRKLASLGPGSYFGEIALLRDVPRTATVTAEEPMRLLALERDEFLAAMTGSRPSIQRADTEIDRRLAEHHPGSHPPVDEAPGDEG